MILSDLFEELESPAQEARRLMREWRDSAAAEPYELTIDSSGTNASNAFPVVRKAGTWYGGIFTPRGGNSKETDRMLGVNHRAKAWVKKELAQSIEALVASGREVRVSSESSGNLQLNFYQQAEVVRQGEAAQQLLKHTVESKNSAGKRLAVYWWASASADKAGVTTLNITVTFGFDMNKPATNASMLISGAKPEIKVLAAQIVHLKRDDAEKSIKLARELVMTFFPEAKVRPDTWAQMHVEIGSAAKYYTPVDRDRFLNIVKKYV